MRREISKEDNDPSKLIPGFFYMAVISSDGQNMEVRISDFTIQVLNREGIQRTLLCLEDAFYKVRPDLRQSNPNSN